jgi:hypothetical protein
LSLLIGALLLALKGGKGNSFLFSATVIGIMAFALCVFSPFAMGFKRINSIAPTYGLLIGAGYLLRARPNWSFLFVGASSLFRVINGLFFIPFLFLYLYQQLDWSDEKIVNSLLKKTAVALALFMIGGAGFYFIYVWILLGNPLAPTYSAADTEFAALSQVWDNVIFYFDLEQGWFKANIIFLAFTVILSIISRRNRKWAIFSFALVCMNYGFFIIHKVQIIYYPYASAMIVLGIFLYGVEEEIHERKYEKFLQIGLAPIIVALALFCLSGFPVSDTKAEFQKQVMIYREAFGKYDVIWGTFRTGTIEYTTDRASFRYEWGPEAVRRDVIAWLRDHGYSQAFWADDDRMDLEHIEKELTEIRINYDVLLDPALGTIVEIADTRL